MMYKDSQPVGTIPYLAPEQVDGKYHTKAVDLWAVGIIGLAMSEARFSERLLPSTDGVLEYLQWGLEKAGTDVALCLRGLMEVQPEKRMDAMQASEIMERVLRRKKVEEAVSRDNERKDSFGDASVVTKRMKMG